MHIPDGFLDTKTIVATSAFSAAGVLRALRNVTRRITPRYIPLMGLAAAFIFVAQMLNFPVAGGTSGHVIGGVLVSILLGPSAGIVVMTVVLVVQCFLFADGGVLSLGANVFNMGIVAVVCGYYFYRIFTSVSIGMMGRLAVVAAASWISTVIASICCTGELAWSGTIGWSNAFPAMTGIHMIIGIGEAIITTLILAAIYRTRPALLSGPESAREGRAWNVVSEVLPFGILITLGLALFVTPFVTVWPDGLERVAAEFGFSAKSKTAASSHSPLAGYQIPGIGSVPVAMAIAAVIGATLVFLTVFLLGRALVSRSKDVSS